MTMNLFGQFATPYILGAPLAFVAMALPTMILFPHHALITNRLAALQGWLLFNLTKQLLTPLNKAGHTWSLLLSTLMIYLLTLNLLGLLPYTFTPTTQLSMNMGLAIPLWFATVLIGLRGQPTASLAHMLPLGTPTPLIPILILIETVSLIIRPLALGVRLTANLTAGHLLMTLISVAFLTLLSTMPTISLLTLTLLFLLAALEMAVAMIQAYVFTLLLSLYLQENT